MNMFWKYLNLASYLPLGISALVLCSLQFGAVFIEKFEIINETNVEIVVTPVGAWEGTVTRGPLPVSTVEFIFFPALKNGAYSLAPGESIRICYDSDDFDLSEIEVDAAPNLKLELVVNPTPTVDSFNGGELRRFPIRDLAKLPPATAPVIAAANSANRNGMQVLVISSLLFGPWILVALVEILSFLARGFSPTSQDEITNGKPNEAPKAKGIN